MNEQKITYVLESLGETINNLRGEVSWRKARIESLEKEVAALKAKQNTTDHLDKVRSEYIESLESKVEELEERVAIMSESTGTADMWLVEAPKKSSNVTTVEEGEQ